MTVNYIHGSNGLGEAVRANISEDREIGDMSFIVDSVLNWPAYFIATAATMGSDGYLTDMTIFFGYLAGGIIMIDHFAPGYPDVGNLTNQVIVLKPTTAWADEVASATGVQGPQGGVGVQGNQGSQGSIGHQGSQGNQSSVAGSQGVQGSQGLTGVGSQGVQGNQGPKGYQGDKGNQGDKGSQGNQGASVTGAQGNQGSSVTGAQGSQGSAGTNGTNGSQGNQGSQGASVTGSQGSQGNQGTKGAQGNQGDKGSQGNQGGAGTNGTNGSQGNQGASVTGAQGNQGNAGTNGSQGVQGNQGNPASGSKASSAEVDTGTDDAKFVTALAISGSKNVPHLVPGTTGNVMQSDGTNWASNTLVSLLGTIYPVGCIYTSTVSTNPATTFGFGTWAAYGAGQFLVGKAAAGTFNTGGATGGAETVTLTAAQSGVPAHTHVVQTAYTAVGSTAQTNVWNGNAGSSWSLTSQANAAANAASAHSNLPPYVVVYFWNRTA